MRDIICLISIVIVSCNSSGNTIIENNLSNPLDTQNQEKNNIIFLDKEISSHLVSFFLEFELSQKSIAAQCSSNGTLRSGTHITLVENSYSFLLDEFNIKLKKSINALLPYLLNSEVMSLTTQYYNKLVIYSENSIVSDYEYLNLNINVISQFKTDFVLISKTKYSDIVNSINFLIK